MENLRSYLALLRPRHYIKNGFIFLPVFFAHRAGDIFIGLRLLSAFVSFSLAASAIYIINDICDAEADRKHPVKCRRPIASGAVSTAGATTVLLFLAIGALGSGLLTGSRSFLGILLLYLVLNTAYSIALKHISIIDITIVSAGFVLRVYAGSVVADVWLSHWLVLMTFLIAMFIALAKRRDDLVVANGSQQVRASMDGYSFDFVLSGMMVMGAVTIVSYILYTLSPEVVAKHDSPHLYTTAIWVITGILRYLQITFVLEKSGSPTEVLYTDRFIQTVVTGWIIHLFVLIYL